MIKCCDTCAYYKIPDAGLPCGTCDYPVPEWIKIGAGGGFIASSAISGAECGTFKSLEEVAEEVK